MNHKDISSKKVFPWSNPYCLKPALLTLPSSPWLQLGFTAAAFSSINPTLIVQDSLSGSSGWNVYIDGLRFSLSSARDCRSYRLILSWFVSSAKGEFFMAHCGSFRRKNDSTGVSSTLMPSPWLVCTSRWVWTWLNCGPFDSKTNGLAVVLVVGRAGVLLQEK